MAGLGEILRSTRQRKGFSLAEAESATRVRQKYLEALEEGKYDLIPARVYAKGFLRAYAELLDLDRDELLALMEVEWPAPKRQTLQPEARYVSSPSAVTGGMVVSVLLLLVLAVLAYYLYQQYTLYQATARATPVVAAQPTLTPSPTAKLFGLIPPAATASPPSSPTAPAATPRPDQIVVETKIVETSWLRVTADDKVAFEGTLEPGQTRSWVAVDKIVVRTGNGAGVEVAFNGKKQGLMGARGDVLEKQWTRP